MRKRTTDFFRRLRDQLARMAMTPEVRARLDALAYELARTARERDQLADALRELAYFGSRSDRNPTMPAGGARPTQWWYDYLGRADRSVRDRARDALARVGDDARIDSIARELFERDRFRLDRARELFERDRFRAVHPPPRTRP